MRYVTIYEPQYPLSDDEKQKIRHYRWWQRSRCDNKIFVDGDIAIGHTSKGEPFIFDTDLLPIVTLYSWRITDLGYVVARDHLYKRVGQQLILESLDPQIIDDYIDGYHTGSKTIFLHRLIMGVNNKKLTVDHIGCDKTDNRRKFLRVCTQKDNLKNRSFLWNSKTGHPGVRFDKRKHKWVATIKKDGVTTHLGLFNEIEDAIEARNIAEQSDNDAFMFWRSQEFYSPPTFSENKKEIMLRQYEEEQVIPYPQLRYQE